MDPASYVTKTVPLTPLGAEKSGVKFLTLTNISGKGGLPHPQFLYCWKDLTELYNICQFGVSSPRNKKTTALPLKSPIAPGRKLDT